MIEIDLLQEETDMREVRALSIKAREAYSEGRQEQIRLMNEIIFSEASVDDRVERADEELEFDVLEAGIGSVDNLRVMLESFDILRGHDEFDFEAYEALTLYGQGFGEYELEEIESYQESLQGSADTDVSVGVDIGNIIDVDAILAAES